MITEIITDETVGKYLGFLKNEEIFGIGNGRFTCIGVCDDNTEDPMGILTAEVHMEHIRIRRLFVRPGCPRRKTAKMLISVITDLPDEMKMPVFFFGTEEETDPDFLAGCGFMELPFSRYSYFEGYLEDLKEIGELPKACDITTLDQVPKKQVESYIQEAKHDRFLQIPDDYPDRDRFSEASLVCMEQGRVAGLILLEETDDHIDIPFIRTKDDSMMIYAFYVLRKLLLSEYAPKARLRIVICDSVGMNAIRTVFPGGEEKKILAFRHG